MRKCARHRALHFGIVAGQENVHNFVFFGRIREWREVHDSNARSVYWHEGQMRAYAGQTDQAIALLEQSKNSKQEDEGSGWNLYVEGSIAFLRRDRAALIAARSKLAALPRPENFYPVGSDGKPLEMTWPPNLEILDDLLSCWDKPYQEAYNCSLPG